MLKFILFNNFGFFNVFFLFLGLGGAFLINSGKAKHHIMPEFSKLPLNTDEEVNNWLKFFEFKAPLVAVGTMVSCEIPVRCLFYRNKFVS